MDNAEVCRFFADTKVNILSNVALRDPQREAYLALVDYFASKSAPCYVQLPVGCGKSGLIGLTPFGITEGRILILVPNTTIRATIFSELDISSPDNFYARRGVFTPTSGPYLSELKPTANIHDCDAAHMVVANIQQFAGQNNKWYEKFPRDYFRMILVDEGHHNVADSWTRLFEHFHQAKIVSYTATPLRSDGKSVLGEKVYSFTYARSMIMGFISPVEAVHVAPEAITFTAKGITRTLSLEEVLKYREHDWFSKGIALSETCNRHIVQASVRQLNEIRKLGSPRQIIASACSIRHATQIAALYHEHNLRAEVISSEQDVEKRQEIEHALRTGLLDVVVQVQMLGEGYNLGSLSVAAVFRPYRSLSPYIQFIGRILRLADPAFPHSPGNRVYVVSHVGLNDERWWHDFSNFDKSDQQFFSEYMGAGASIIDDAATGPRLTLRPFMRVLNELVEKYLHKAYLKQIDRTLVSQIIEEIRSKGFDPGEFGLSEEMMLRRLQLGAVERESAAAHIPTQPQRRKEGLRIRVAQDARSIADTVLNRLELKHNGQNLLRYYPGVGASNSAVLVRLAAGAQNKAMGVSAGERDDASIEQFEAALEASANIVDALTAGVRAKLKGK